MEWTVEKVLDKLQNCACSVATNSCTRCPYRGDLDCIDKLLLTAHKCIKDLNDEFNRYIGEQYK